MRIKVKKEEIYCYLLFISLFKLCFLPETIQLSIKAFFLIVSFIYFFKVTNKKDLFNAVILISLSCLASSLISHNYSMLSTQNVIKSFVYGLSLYTIYLMAKHFQVCNGYFKLIRYLYNITTIYCLLSIISIFSSGASVSGVETYYWFGTKFMVSYLFMLWLVLYKMINADKTNQKQRKKIVYCLRSIAVGYLTYILNCGTAFLASIFIFIDQFIPDTIRSFFKKPIIVFTSFFMAGLFPYVYTLILSNAYIKKVFFEFLGRTLTLTGRTIIYDKLLYMISARPLWGYGYGNEAVKSFVSMNYGNVQNGVAQWMVDYGIVGLIVLLIFMYTCLRRSEQNNYLNGWYSIFYALIFCSTVEVSFNFVFFLSLIIIGVFKNAKIPVKNIYFHNAS